MNWERLFYLRMKGFNAIEIGKDMNMHPTYINFKLRELKKMDDDEFKELVRTTFRRLI